MPTDFAGMQQDKPGHLITTTGVVAHEDFLALVGRTAAYCGLAGPDRALRWLRLQGVTGDWRQLSPAAAAAVLDEAARIKQSSPGTSGPCRTTRTWTCSPRPWRPGEIPTKW